MVQSAVSGESARAAGLNRYYTRPPIFTPIWFGTLKVWSKTAPVWYTASVVQEMYLIIKENSVPFSSYSCQT